MRVSEQSFEDELVGKRGMRTNLASVGLLLRWVAYNKHARDGALLVSALLFLRIYFLFIFS
jgi:hypothetical protein